MTHAERAARRKVIAGAYQAGEDVVDVAARYGVSEWYVRKAKREAGLRDRLSKRQAAALKALAETRRARSAPRNAEIRAAASAGESLDSLAGRYSLSYKRIEQILSPLPGEV
jgi:Mor family transcriptional regulator